ncbi:ASA1 (YPR085C) [Zygosaccharomyces parabailii]|uniref:ZYBA0S04-09868g1_1 n=1 Tax=Zygosaccharomyces bailii (strain CLIB 213 / ATCC 58445 / CBS 680 / BCRC 21525 / NBRC 1098 / NCYC 1416 / NRRL Y-2227) TaxID=1333698 RepID=A0A8J2T962_ZYGB2|nr:ASA1 (YPR085C) [Zygosaccharomyces parabailii]CDF89671.1 ZYBA0S04-09868g1_1 [Zygosaccharomyces bailii CLIB 213]CDH13794.1 related to ASTRA-associated protein 1 [Zygosaccharomyces bailii ISA1307]
MNDLRLPDYTLRFHKSSVTTLLVLQLPGDPTPVLLSGDATGVLILWNLITRRPITNYHIETSPRLVALQYIGLASVAVLCKDHKLRIFNIGDLPRWKQVYEIPINTLNFANFVIENLGDAWFRLICCNTQDAESIDIYVFHLTDLHSLRRVYKGLKFYESLIPLLGDTVKLDKLGIAMKFVECNGVIYCGMESGFVIGFTMIKAKKTDGPEDEEPANQSVRIVYVSNVHYPDPVLDLCVTPQFILSSSTGNKIGVHDWRKLSYPNSSNENCPLVLTKDNFKRVPLSQVSHVKQVDDFLLLASWSGEIVVLDQHYAFIAKFVKSKSLLQVTENSKGNLQGSSATTLSKENSLNCKITSLQGISAVHVRTEAENKAMSATISMGKKRRLQKFIENAWCIVSYEDGSIAFYRLEEA